MSPREVGARIQFYDGRAGLEEKQIEIGRCKNAKKPFL